MDHYNQYEISGSTSFQELFDETAQSVEVQSDSHLYVAMPTPSPSSSINTSIPSTSGKQPSECYVPFATDFDDSMSLFSPTPSKSARKIIKKKDPEVHPVLDDLLQTMKRNQQIVSERSQTQKCHCNNIDPFFLYAAKEFTNLNDDNQMEFRITVLNLLKHYKNQQKIIIE